jgi:hypothetical protein
LVLTVLFAYRLPRWYSLVPNYQSLFQTTNESSSAFEILKFSEPEKPWSHFPQNWNFVEPRYTEEIVLKFSTPKDLSYLGRKPSLGDLARNWESVFGAKWLSEKLVFEKNLPLFEYETQEKWELLKGLLHSHTQESDGQGTWLEALNVAKNDARLDFFAITDHPEYWLGNEQKTYDKLLFEIKNFQAQQKNTEDSNFSFIAIPGFEYSHPLFGHFVVLFSDTVATAFSHKTLHEFYKWLVRSNGIAIFAHPGYHKQRGKWDFHEFSFPENFSNEEIKILKQKVVGIETIHKNLFQPFLKGYSQKIPYLWEAMGFGWRPAVFASQDNHRKNWGVQDSSRTFVKKRESQTLKDAIINRQSVSSMNENLVVSSFFTLCGKRYVFGSLIPNVCKNSVGKLEFRMLDTNKNLPLQRLELWSAGQKIWDKVFFSLPKKIENVFWNNIPSDKRKIPKDKKLSQGILKFAYEWDVKISMPLLNVQSLELKIVQSDNGYEIVTHFSPFYFSSQND